METGFAFAGTPEEIAGAIRLITAVYEKSGYVREGESSALSRFLASTATATFIARAADRIVGTISVISDSPEGLPMDLLYKNELAPLRQRGLLLAEVGQFAIEPEVGLKDRTLSLSLFKLALHYGLRKGFDLFCITVNPKHEAFYRSMGFEIFAETRDYPSVENAPAVPMTLDLKKLAALAGSGASMNILVKEIFKNPPEEAILTQALAKAAS